MQMIALIMVSALFGAGGVVVKDQVQEARQQEILLAEVAGNQRIAEMEMDLLAQQYREVEEQYQAGLVREDALLSARLGMVQAELRLTRLRLDEEEIRSTGREPQDRLSAPLVDGRDLVTERLELDVTGAMEEGTVARAQLARTQELHASAVVDDAELMEAMIPVQEVEARVDALERRMELRRRVLDGEIGGQAAEREAEASQVRGELETLLRERDTAALRLQRMEDLVNQGMAPESQLGGARLHLMQLETRMEILRLRLQILEEEG